MAINEENQVIIFDFWISSWRITCKVHALPNGKLRLTIIVQTIFNFSCRKKVTITYRRSFYVNKSFCAQKLFGYEKFLYTKNFYVYKCPLCTKFICVQESFHAPKSFVDKSIDVYQCVLYTTNIHVRKCNFTQNVNIEYLCVQMSIIHKGIYVYKCFRTRNLFVHVKKKRLNFIIQLLNFSN